MAVTDSFRNSLSKMSEREQKLLVLLGIIFVAMVVFLPLYLISSSISEMGDDNEAISEVLREIASARPELAAREAEREASMARYQVDTPPLGSFLESQATTQELQLREVTEQPDVVTGDFTRRNTRATLHNVGLRPVVKMLTSIVNSRYPVALERLQVEHFREGDTYNIQLGVVAYHRGEGNESGDEDEGGDMDGRRNRRDGRAGPPSP